MSVQVRNIPVVAALYLGEVPHRESARWLVKKVADDIGESTQCDRYPNPVTIYSKVRSRTYVYNVLYEIAATC
jgi:hypothetical protein